MSWPILLVDDDEDLRETTTHVLAARGYRVWTAGDGQQALALLTEDGLRPALILLDLEMPVMDGRTLLLHLAADAQLAKIPVVVITAQPAGAPLCSLVDEILPKPIQLHRLLSAIQKRCGGSTRR